MLRAKIYNNGYRYYNKEMSDPARIYYFMSIYHKAMETYSTSQ